MSKNQNPFELLSNEDEPSEILDTKSSDPELDQPSTSDAKSSCLSDDDKAWYGRQLEHLETHARDPKNRVNLTVILSLNPSLEQGFDQITEDDRRVSSSHIFLARPVWMSKADERRKRLVTRFHKSLQPSTAEARAALTEKEPMAVVTSGTEGTEVTLFVRRPGRKNKQHSDFFTLPSPSSAR